MTDYYFASDRLLSHKCTANIDSKISAWIQTSQETNWTFKHAAKWVEEDFQGLVWHFGNVPHLRRWSLKLCKKYVGDNWLKLVQRIKTREMPVYVRIIRISCLPLMFSSFYHSFSSPGLNWRISRKVLPESCCNCTFASSHLTCNPLEVRAVFVHC